MDNLIIIEKNKNNEFETNSFFKSAINFIFIPILNNLPKSFQKKVKKTHKSADQLIEKATSHTALEILYHHGKVHDSKNLQQKIFRKIWFSRNNAKAVRNRLKIVRRELIKEINRHKDNGINLLSIASGSARAVVEAFLEVDEIKGAPVSISFLDKSPEALEYSKSLVDNLPKGYSFNWIEGTANTFQNYFPNEKPNIIEMVGLLDYFDDEKILQTFKTIYNNLQDNGVLVTANIIDNKERKFIERIVGWNMIYSTPEDFIRLAEEAGFSKDKMKVYVEPMKIHFILVAQK